MNGEQDKFFDSYLNREIFNIRSKYSSNTRRYRFKKVHLPTHLVEFFGSVTYPILHLQTLVVAETGKHKCEQLPRFLAHALVPRCLAGS